MKRVFVLLLTLFYLMFTSGMTISAHYCGGKLTSVSLLRLGKEKCPCGSKKMKKDCCKTKSCTFKINNRPLSFQSTRLSHFQRYILLPIQATYS